MEDERNSLNNSEGKEEEKKTKRSWKERFQWRYVRWVGYAMAGFIVFVLLMDKIVMPLYTKHGQELSMPNVQLMPLEEAKEILKRNDFRPIVDHKKYSISIPEGNVISQNPLPGSIVKSGRRTYLIVSKGEKWVKVPKLIGGSERNAEIKLRRLDLVPQEKPPEFSSLYPENVVISQSVPPGDSLSVGDTVQYVVSLGDIPENLKVPDVVGKSFEEAKKTLLESGFRIGQISYQTNNDLLPKTVIQQSLKPDSLVDVNATIDLILSQIEEKPEEKEDIEEKFY